MSGELFNRLVSAAPEFASGDNARWIKRKSDNDAKILSKARADAVRLGRHLGACLLDYDGRTYIILVGLGGLEYTITGLSACTSTPALFQLAVSGLDLTPTATEAEIRNALQDQDSSQEDYDGHELDAIEPLFPHMTYAEVTDHASLFLKDVYRVLGIAICKSGYELPLDLDEESRKAFVDVFENSSEHYPIHLALQGLVASFWQTQFVEIYRTIERLFPVIPVSKLSKRISFSNPTIELNSALYDTLGWRPKEDGALENLVRLLPKDIIESYRQSFGIQPDAENLNTLVSRHIYNTRNSVVHYRGLNDAATLSDEQWQSIIQLTCRFSIHIYQRLAAQYFPNAVP
jgi:hypothetical protein